MPKTQFFFSVDLLEKMIYEYGMLLTPKESPFLPLSDGVWHLGVIYGEHARKSLSSGLVGRNLRVKSREVSTKVFVQSSDLPGPIRRIHLKS